MSQLFSPVSFGPLQLPNRIVIAPMCQYSATDGQANDWHRQHLGQLSQSGAGLLILEATAVLPEGRISWADLGLWDDATEAALAGVIASVKAWSPMPLGVQLAHAGRKASSARPWDGGGGLPATDPNGWTTVAPSALPFNDHPKPEALDLAGIDAIVDAFVAAAQRAERIGLDLIELHAAHGYLLHQFLSPLSNQRDDEYGGSLQNRMRLLIRVFDAVREAVSEHIAVGVRVSASDWVAGGWDIEQTTTLAQILDLRGCNFLHVSSGGLDPRQKIPLEPGYQVPFAQAIKAAKVRMPVIAVGLITDPSQAESILRHGHADAVALARGILYDPRWPWHAAAALGDSITPAPQYLRCEPREARGVFTAPGK